jgi:hypothetical protein
MNETGVFTQAVVGVAENAAVGFCPTVTLFVAVAVHEPAVTVSVIVYVPAVL